MAAAPLTMECPGCGVRLKIQPRVPADRRVMCPHCGTLSKAPRRLIPDGDAAKPIDSRIYLIVAAIVAVSLFAFWLRWR